MNNNTFKISHILPLIAWFFISVFFAGMIGVHGAAIADEKYPPSVRSYDGVDYAGYLLDSGTVKDFSAKVDVTNSDLETPIFQFVITPSVRGDGSSYTPDFESLTFTLADSKGKTMTVNFAPRKADSPKYYYINCMAKGENQALLGEHQANWQWALDPDDGAYITDVYAAISPYTFDGYGADFSWFNFYDKNGNTFSNGCNGVISIYYSAEENALYADTGFKWVEDDPQKPLTLTDKFTRSESGERRFRIRDFDKNDYRKGNNVITTVWNGFEDPSDVTFTVSFAKVVTENPSILLVSLGGKSIVDNYYMRNFTKGVKNVAFPVPKPLFFSEGNAYDFAALGGKVKIEDFGGNTVLSERNFVDGMTFVPTAAGNYSAYYSVEDPVYSVDRTYGYSFEILENGGTVLIPKGYDRDYVVYETMDAGCTVYNEVQEYLPQVNLKISKNGSEIYSAEDLKDLLYKFESAGEYTFEYSSIDLLGRVTEITKTYSVGEYCLKMKQGLVESVVVNDYRNLTKPSNSDFYIVNVVTGNKITPTGVSMTLSKNGGAFETYKASLINGDGNYVVRYVYTFAGGSLEAQRRFTVFADLPTITLNAIPTNTVFAAGSTLEDDIVRVIALKGSVISIPKGFFGCNLPVTVSLYKDGEEATDCTDRYNADNLSITLNESKDYYVSAAVQTDGGFTVVKNLYICVKDGVINIAPVNDVEEGVGREITLIVPEAKDFYGNPVPIGSFSVLFNGEEIEVINGRFTPEDLGVYHVTYSVSLSGVTKTCEYRYRISDSEAPEIVLGKIKETVSRGKFVKVNDYKVSDNSDKSLDVRVTVTYNGEAVAVYNGGFDANKEGEYKVKITATDMSGNSSFEEYTVTVAGGGCSSTLDASGTAGLVVLLFLAAGALYLVKKRHEQ